MSVRTHVSTCTKWYVYRECTWMCLWTMIYNTAHNKHRSRTSNRHKNGQRW
jgi:hypothetical protein